MTKPGSRLSRSLAFGVATGLTSLPAYDKIPPRVRRRIIGWGSVAGALAAGGATFAASRRGAGPWSGVEGLVDRDAATGSVPGAEHADEAGESVPATPATPANPAFRASPAGGLGGDGAGGGDARPEPSLRQKLAATGGLALAGGVATAGALWFSFWCDRKAVQFLRAKGVRAARVWLAGGGAVLGAVMEFVDQPKRDDRTVAPGGAPLPKPSPADAEGARIFSAS